MPQYGVLVYSPAPADPRAFDADLLERLDAYDARAKELGGKVLGGSYFSGHRGFAFESSTTAVAITRDEVRSGPLLDSGLVVSAFYVLSAPGVETAVEIAKAHPAVREGGVEVRPLFDPSNG